MTYSAEQIITSALARVSDKYDKRVGSIIRDAIAPVAVELANAYTVIEIMKEQTYLLYAVGENLDLRAADFAMQRYQATKARRTGLMYDKEGELTEVALGSRYATPSETGGISYVARERVSAGNYILECETAGIQGNSYIGDILPLDYNNNLGRSELTGEPLLPANDKETDEAFRQRVLDRINGKAFGGNIADYKRYIKEELSTKERVGAVKVFPVWAGGGTVLLSIVDSQFDSISPEFSQEIKAEVDPLEFTQKGYGTAPIGHKVTITTPERVEINVEARISLDGYTIGQVQEDVEAALNSRLYELRKDWANSTTVNIYQAVLIADLIGLSGKPIINVSSLAINGIEGDLLLDQTKELQQLPYLGSVTLHEG